MTVTDTVVPSSQTTASVPFTVTSVSDSLTITNTANQNMTENTPLTFSIVLVSDGSITCDAAHLSGTGTGLSFAFSGTPAACQVTITPSLNQLGTVSVEITAEDDTITTSDTFDVLISPDGCLPTNSCEQRCTSVAAVANSNT